MRECPPPAQMKRTDLLVQNNFLFLPATAQSQKGLGTLLYILRGDIMKELFPFFPPEWIVWIARKIAVVQQKSSAIYFLSYPKNKSARQGKFQNIEEVPLCEENKTKQPPTKANFWNRTGCNKEEGLIRDNIFQQQKAH